jgi:hypothetical protein
MDCFIILSKENRFDLRKHCVDHIMFFCFKDFYLINHMDIYTATNLKRTKRKNVRSSQNT